MARPSKLDAMKAGHICRMLAAGVSRKAAAAAVGIHYNTFLNWLKCGNKAKSGEFMEFLEAVTRAEAQAEILFTAVLVTAATGYDAMTSTRTIKTVHKLETTIHPDRRVVKRLVPLQEVTETTTTTRVCDWRAALEWLKRRRPKDWGDRYMPNLDHEIEALIAELIGDGKAGAEKEALEDINEAPGSLSFHLS